MRRRFASIAAMLLLLCGIGAAPSPKVHYSFDQDHAGDPRNGVGGNGRHQIVVKDSAGTQDGLLVRDVPNSNPDFDPSDKKDGGTYFFDADASDGGGSWIGDGAAKFGNALHIRPSNSNDQNGKGTGSDHGFRDEGHVKVLGDVVTTNSEDYILDSSTKDLFDSPAGAKWTIEFWFRLPTTIPGPTNLLSHGRGTTGVAPQLNVMVDRDGKIKTQIRAEGVSSAASNATTKNYADGKWHHYAIVHDGDNLIVYLDDGNQTGGPEGEQLEPLVRAGGAYTEWGIDAPGASTSEAPSATTDNEPYAFFIGLFQDSAKPTAGGKPPVFAQFDIDDFAYYDAALKIDQIHWNSEIATK